MASRFLAPQDSGHAAVLACHPRLSSRAVRDIQVQVAWRDDGALTLSYRLAADLSRLAIPPPRAPSRAPRLWEHTCFEAFVRSNQNPGYYEFNFSPSGEWAIYAFRSYRDGIPFADEDAPPSIVVERATGDLRLDTVIHPDRVLPGPPGATLQIALAAVIEEKSGALSYWALRHPPGKPDFHHPEAFALELKRASRR
ncbi:MAG TPA: DOMON-like domain-containing protein [Candidatus Acidoferrales bacterium]|nr:DOMON-like domain-containing protein [Candidatus Acidoferrales bacterium]